MPHAPTVRGCAWSQGHLWVRCGAGAPPFPTPPCPKGCACTSRFFSSLPTDSDSTCHLLCSWMRRCCREEGGGVQTYVIASLCVHCRCVLCTVRQLHPGSNGQQSAAARGALSRDCLHGHTKQAHSKHPKLRHALRSCRPPASPAPGHWTHAHAMQVSRCGQISDQACLRV